MSGDFIFFPVILSQEICRYHQKAAARFPAKDRQDNNASALQRSNPLALQSSPCTVVVLQSSGDCFTVDLLAHRPELLTGKKWFAGNC